MQIYSIYVIILLAQLEFLPDCSELFVERELVIDIEVNSRTIVIVYTVAL